MFVFERNTIWGTWSDFYQCFHWGHLKNYRTFCAFKIGFFHCVGDSCSGINHQNPETSATNIFSTISLLAPTKMTETIDKVDCVYYYYNVWTRVVLYYVHCTVIPTCKPSYERSSLCRKPWRSFREMFNHRRGFEYKQKRIFLVFFQVQPRANKISCSLRFRSSLSISMETRFDLLGKGVFFFRIIHLLY